MDKLDLIVDKIETHHEFTQKRLDNIDKNLAEHMRRTDVLEDLHRDNQTRIEKLEEPKKALLLLKTWVIGLGTLAASVVAILKLFNVL